MKFSLHSFPTSFLGDIETHACDGKIAAALMHKALKRDKNAEVNRICICMKQKHENYIIVSKSAFLHFQQS